MADSDGKHVFISYVHEDKAEVDSLCKILDAAQIPYWRDRTDLGPGDAWRAKIRQAIRDGSLVFLACFSDNSRAKQKSYMNEELTVAVDQFRAMPPGRTWLIPVRFDAGDMPEWDLGAGRLLSDLNYSDLFGDDHMANAARLVTTIHRLTGEKQADAATALAAVEQATAANRTDLLRRLTKEMIVDPARRIELDDLISNEVQRVMAVLNDDEHVQGPFGGTNNEQIVRLATEARELWKLTEPFCASLQVAARWGTSGSLAPWCNGLRSFVSVTTKPENGVPVLIALRHVPGMVGLMVAALSAVSSKRWDNLKSLVVDETVRERYEQEAIPLFEATDPYVGFGNGWVSNVLARGTIQDTDLETALADFLGNRVGKYRSAEAEWMHHILRPIFKEQWPDDTAYDEAFDRAEVVLGVLNQDLANLRASANPAGRSWSRSNWYGRSVWRSRYNHANPIEDLARELTAQGPAWPPLLANLFGANVERAESAIVKYSEAMAGAGMR